MADRDLIRINCQNCKAAIGIPKEYVTDESRSIICPRCQQSVSIKRSQFEIFFTYSMHCPKCSEIQNASEECIYCNVLISKFIKIKKISSAWDILSKRFIAKNPAPVNENPLNPSRDLTVKCPNCGFSKKLSKNECPSYITRIGCPQCNQSFDIVNWMQIKNQFS